MQEICSPYEISDGLWHMGSINYGSQFEQTDFSSGDLSFLNVQGNQGVWSDPPTSIAEPGTLLLLGIGLAALTLKRRRKAADTTVWETLG